MRMRENFRKRMGHSWWRAAAVVAAALISSPLISFRRKTRTVEEPDVLITASDGPIQINISVRFHFKRTHQIKRAGKENTAVEKSAWQFLGMIWWSVATFEVYPSPSCSASILSLDFVEGGKVFELLLRKWRVLTRHFRLLLNFLKNAKIASSRAIFLLKGKFAHKWQKHMWKKKLHEEQWLKSHFQVRFWREETCTRRKFSECLGAGASLAPRIRQRISVDPKMTRNSGFGAVRPGKRRAWALELLFRLR